MPLVTEALRELVVSTLSAACNLDAQTIDLQTGRPFDKRGFRAAISGQAAYYDNNRSYAPRLAGLISNTWGDFGILVSGAYSKRKAQEDGYSDTSQSDYSDALNGFCGVAVDDPNQAGSQVINTPIPFVNTLSGSGNRPPNQCFSGLPSNAGIVHTLAAFSSHGGGESSASMPASRNGRGVPGNTA